MTYDLAVVGAGPAGLATAIFGQLAGLSTVVFDQRQLPLDKACGEGILPTGVAALCQMGVSLAPEAHATLLGVSFREGELLAQADFPSGVAKGVRRTTLIAAMAERAGQLGAELHFGAAVRAWQVLDGGTSVRLDAGGQPTAARLLVAADGLHSSIRARLGLERRGRRAPRFGVRRHFGLPPWSRYVEVHWHERAQAYVTPVGPEEVGVAILWQGDGGSFDELFALFPALAARVAGAPATSSTRGAGPFAKRASRRAVPAVALVGDAAGDLDPLSGDALSLAFRSAEALVEVVRRGRPLDEYDSAYRRLSRPYYASTELMLALSFWAPLRHRVLQTLASHPEELGRLLGVTTREVALRSLGLKRAMRLARGLL